MISLNFFFSFMICCDQCEEWYHGDCVGISVGQGKRMEREGKEYICPVCIARLEDAKEEREMNRYVCMPGTKKSLAEIR